MKPKKLSVWEKEFWDIWNNWNDVGGHDTDPDDLINLIAKQRQKIENNIGFLRQWLNETPKDRLVTNKDIEEWLFNFRPHKEAEG